MGRGQVLSAVLAVTTGGCFPSFDGLSSGQEPTDAGADHPTSTPLDSSADDADLTAPDVASCVSTSDCVTPGVCAFGACGGLVGNYYANPDLSGKNVIRTDATVDFDWGFNGPVPGIGPDHFSVRWTGHVTPRYSETYTFYTTSDDGAVLWVDDTKVIDHWTPHPATEDSGSITLVAGVAHGIKLEYFDGINEALVTLAWASPTQPKEIISTSELTP